MKTSAEDSPSTPVTLRGVSIRLTWLVYLATTALGCVLGFYSVLFMRVDFLGGAVASGAVALLARSVLREWLAVNRTDEGVSEEMDDFPSENENTCSGQVRGLVQLLHEWEGLERSRGTANFDPWALQSARNEIREAVHGDPALERLFGPRK